MILDSLANFDNYVSLHPLFKAVSDFIKSHDLASLPTGKVEIVADKAVFANVMVCELKAAQGARSEYHRKYIDVQILLDDGEEMGWQPLSAAAATAPFDEEKDVAFMNDAPVTMVKVPAGYFTVFMPTDAHAPCCGEPGKKVRKIVVKVQA